MDFLIRKKHVNRHRILETLQNYYNEHWRPDCEQIDILLSFSELIKHSKLSEKEIIEQLPYLQREKEINYIEIEYSSYYIITENGTLNLYDKKHYTVGRKMLNDETYDTVKNISTIILLIIALITFVINLFETRNNKIELENIKTEIQNLKVINSKP